MIPRVRSAGMGINRIQGSLEDEDLSLGLPDSGSLTISVPCGRFCWPLSSAAGYAVGAGTAVWEVEGSSGVTFEENMSGPMAVRRNKCDGRRNGE